IAKRFGVALNDLIAANPQIKNPDLIFPGDVVFIPDSHKPPRPGRRYIVQKGDTLFLIAKRFGVALDDLIAANPQIKNPDLIFPGDVVFIPKDDREDRREDRRDDRREDRRKGHREDDRDW
ncbi:MAG TPA: LysM peptidoglycan-binding domain-containing protein, partial [Firmicutes bacterium]|nr:LysM peptidoglycan-binding domain-containing protein [Bacillota bacterium]